MKMDKKNVLIKQNFKIANILSSSSSRTIAVSYLKHNIGLKNLVITGAVIKLTICPNIEPLINIVIDLRKLFFIFIKKRSSNNHKNFKILIISHSSIHGLIGKLNTHLLAFSEFINLHLYSKSL